jgi:Icc-related predicted phosphoesterase
LKKLEIEESKIMKMTQISASIQYSIFVVSGQLLAEIIKRIGGNVGNARKKDKSPIVFNFGNHYHQ